MKKMPEDVDLRQWNDDRGHKLAVLALSEAEVLESEEGLRLVGGVWDGRAALALVADRDYKASRDSHVNDLRSLHEMSFKLSLCQDVDEICREAVSLGRSMLGFDRLGIWLRDQGKPNWIIGTWGTDESGELRDERGWRLERKKGEFPESFYEGRVALIYNKDTIYRGDDGKALGTGARLVAPLWDGHSFLGEIGADDFLRHGGFSSEKREVFVTYSRIVSHLMGLKRAEAELRQLASTDSLTGTVNRRTALIILEKCLGQCRRSGTPLTICLADLDGLKLVNDAFGHSAGDRYIRRASETLVGAVRASDTVGRIGGDEFLVVFPDCRGDLVAKIMERVNSDLAADSWADYVPRLSWGIASPDELGKGSWPEKADLQRCIDLLLELADQRMYEDKRSRGATRRAQPGGLAAQAGIGAASRADA